MRKKGIMILCMLFCLLLAACGGRDESGGGKESGTQDESGPTQSSDSQRQEDRSEGYYDLLTTTRQAFDLLASDWKEVFRVEGRKYGGRPAFLGMQFYQGEPVQLWSAAMPPEEASQETEYFIDVFLYREDGSAELMIQDQPWKYGYWNWFLCEDGTFILYSGQEIVTLDSDGAEVSSRKAAYEIWDICQLSDGRIYLLLWDTENSTTYQLAEYDQAKGTFAVVKDDFVFGRPPEAIGEGENGLLYMDLDGYWEVDPVEKNRSAYLLFEGTSYYENFDSRKIQAVRVSDKGLEILRSNGRMRRADSGGSGENQGAGEVETLRMADVGQERIPITMRGIYFNSRWMKDQITRFNESRDDYYIVLEEWPENSDFDDFVSKTRVEIAAGKGPDILCGELLEESIYSLIGKGVFEDLKPYMDRSGIREEDYFPLTFSSWRDGEKVYSINSFVKLEGHRIREEVLGSRTEPDIKTLIDALLAYEEDAFYLYNEDSMSLLRIFLEGSENLWGMVNWEEGTCDFGGELFAGILEAAKRYGYDERYRYPAVAQIRVCDSIVLFDSQAEQEKEGMVTSGIMFDDGCHAGSRAEYFILAMNANSEHKEGAWEFLSLLLGEEAQSAMTEYDLPVYRKAFEETAQGLLGRVGEEGSERPQATYSHVNGEMVKLMERSINDLTEGKIEEIRRTLEEARPFPVRPVPVIDIICEEAADYFNGTKGIEEVRAVVENRVQLYLGENN